MRPTKPEIRRREKAPAPSAPNSRCHGTTKAGKPCPAPATNDGYCPMHSPRFSDAERKAWRARGNAVAAKARVPQKFTPSNFGNADRTRKVLDEAADLVRAGRLPVSVANAVSKLAGAATKIAEIAAKEKLAELERQIAGKTGRARG